MAPLELDPEKLQQKVQELQEQLKRLQPRRNPYLTELVGRFRPDPMPVARKAAKDADRAFHMAAFAIVLAACALAAAILALVI